MVTKAYRGNYMSRARAHEWHNKFSEGCRFQKPKKMKKKRAKLFEKTQCRNDC